jgi:chlorite dismutase
VPEDFKLDLSEKGKTPDGQPTSLDRRLFMQFLAFGGCPRPTELIAPLQQAGFTTVLYADVNDPSGVGLLMATEQPEQLVTGWRQLLTQPPFIDLTPKPEYTMLGRTYALGYETDLEETLISRPLRKIIDPRWGWAVWYPLQRDKNFENLPEAEQTKILREHGGIGFTYGRAGYATDIRLACHGLDKYDNDFVVGILGNDLYPISSVVQAMRKTKQTSLHLERLGPFFVGKVIWQSAG